MNFQQLVAMIPILEQVDSSCVSQTIECPADCHVLIVVLRGHITISAKEQAPLVFTQGFACHPQYGPFVIQVPRTKEAEYVVITYRILPEDSIWTLHGPLRTVSEVKIKYMLDELIRTIHEIHTHSPEEEAAQQFRKRLILERILFIYIYETHMRQEDKSSAVSLEESLSYINEHYMLKLTLPMLAERAGMSVGHYTVLFKKHTGKTMTGYLRSLRIDKAKEMFLQTRLPAKEIAQRVGFVDYFHFSRIFKQGVGSSPTAFHKNLPKI
ncbi:AraC family transcriptional regulator [Paenibacillus radicis (ex Xue et al. 2023)]|uniref:AraC family transcriptional regulator n=1 Tax=Paenibacillus radicis (ex Xue et al. 2023) TaxID=2972489 RepID=A0ABT1YNN3_9BACL|nr:AraC family transcriptional regulator [Paenibacillus radicis (ex Xue et al. 2023)]MCR8634788.1 AraC family transcriptional regulator [Paenibacillus radicis (ex Xue et al. 2023)]